MRCSIRTFAFRRNSKLISSDLSKSFDDPEFWDLNRISGISSTGLFGYPTLSSPQGLAQATQLAIAKSNEIVRKVCEASEPQEWIKTVKRLDQLSDLLCSVVDAAQLLRSVHPDEQFSQSADESYYTISNYLNQLNTHLPLYHASHIQILTPRLYKGR